MKKKLRFFDQLEKIIKQEDFTFEYVDDQGNKHLQGGKLTYASFMKLYYLIHITCKLYIKRKK